GARLHLLHVEDPLPTTGYPEMTAFLDDDLAAQLRAHQQAYLDEAVRRVAAVTPVPVTSALRPGDIAPTIAAETAGGGAVLVVMARAAPGPVGRFWRGSGAGERGRQARARRLLVRPEESPADLQHEPTLRHVLLPLDGTVLAEQMIEPAVALG